MGGRWRLAIGWTLVALIGLVWAMVLLHLDSTATDVVAADNLRQLWPLWIASAAVRIGLTVMWMILRRQLRDAATDQGRFWQSALMVLLVALGTRAAILTLHEPSLSDDVYRYVFDGRNLAAGYNPYLVFPADRLYAAAERWPGERQLVPRLAFPDLATPYLPVSEAVFGAIGFTIRERSSDPASSARAFRTGFVVIEVAMMLIMFAVLKRARRSAWWAALYAWHPLPISELAGSGHQEVIGIVGLVASLAIFTAVPARTWRWTASLALSALGKPIKLPAAAIMLRGRPLREWLASAAIGAVVIAACIAPPWLIWGDHGRAYELAHHR
jgi:alpha-1,6-mannosyltransferase